MAKTSQLSILALLKARGLAAMRRMKTLITFAIFCCAIARSQEYQGAAVILKQLAEKAQTKAVEKKADPVEELRLKVKALRQEAVGLTPGEAAKRWLALLDAYLTIPSEQLYSQRAYEDRLSLGTIIAALPPPSTWDEIGSLLGARKTSKPLQDEALRLLATVLRGDEAARQASLDSLRKTLTSETKLEDYQREHYQENIDRIAETLEELVGSDAAKTAAFEKRVTLLEKGDEKTRERHGDSLDIPDLVRFAGEKNAEALLTRVLKLGLESVSINGRATHQLAASLALKHIDTLKKPLWELVHTLDHAPLYEALNKKFPNGADWRRHQAIQVYLLALIAADRADDALKLIKAGSSVDEDGNHLSIDVDDLDEMGRQGLGAQVLAFLQRLLADDPELPYWREFIELSARQNTSPAALKLLQDSLARPELEPKARAEMQSHLYLALLAADQREEGIRVLSELVKAGPRSSVGDGEAQAQEMRKRWEQVGVHVTPEMLSRFQQQASGRADGGERDHLALCTRLANLGRLLNKPELIEAALTEATACVDQMSAEDQNRESVLHALIELLLEHQRGPKAEALLAAHLAHLVTPNEKQRGGRPRLDESLGLLTALYVRVGRHADALAVLEQSPYWGAPDLAAFESTNAGDSPLLLVAARALNAAARVEDARRVIRRAAQDYPGNDAVYELLLKLGAEQPLETLLDELAKRDRFEERPLIWKARVLLEAGKVAESETAVRAAIAIDPSDGEQGKGDRMRAYAVLAEVLEKKGDAATAKIMRGAVSAIRKSEEADDWWEAGLLSEAVRRYEASLLDFADAYCIQSRLALRYSELGQFEKAEQHYLRAFELMPDSFGRVESHCFGCEGAFNGQRAQNVADKVFTRLASQPPVKAQVHYLLGYLREAQNRDLEAAEAYRQAVKTDPDYLNAWKELASLADTAQVTRAESENAALQIFRLDPAGRHSSPILRDLRDLRRLWSALLAAEQSLPATETGPLLPLTAAKALIESRQAAGGTNAWDTWSYPSLFSRRNETREHLLQNPLVQTLASFIDSLSNR